MNQQHSVCKKKKKKKKFGKIYSKERREKYKESPEILEGMGLTYKIAHGISSLSNIFGRTNIKKEYRPKKYKEKSKSKSVFEY